MTNSNEELKVGSCVSWFNSHGWSYGKIQSEYELREFTKQVLGTYEWIFGIHTSLIPDGFELVESAELKNTVDENLSLRSDYKQSLEELEAAQKEIERLKGEHRTVWYQVDGNDECYSETIEQAIQEAIDWSNATAGKVLEIRSWETIDRPSFSVEILSNGGDSEGSYKIIEAPKPEGY